MICARPKLRLCLPQLSLGLSNLALRLFNHSLERPGIDLEENLPLGHLRAFTIKLAHQVAADLRLNLGIDIAIQRANPLACHGHIGLLHHDHGNRHGTARSTRSRTCWSCSTLLIVAAGGARQARTQYGHAQDLSDLS